MKRAIVFILFICALLAACTPASPQPTATAPVAMQTATPMPVPTQPATPAPLSAVPPSRIAHLARGINLPFWFWLQPGTSEEIRQRFTDQDFDFIRQLGFTFVRVPIDLTFVRDAQSPDLLNAENLTILDEAFDRIQAHDLAIVVDIHSTSPQDTDSGIYSGALGTDPQFEQDFAHFWQAFAAHLSQRDPEKIFFEIINEPVFENNPQDWPPLQEKLLAAVRSAAPQHTLIATGARWSNLDTLVELTPLSDPNILYNFHFYEPFIFTHQGAGWSWEVVRPLRNIPYPSDPQLLEPLAAQAAPEIQPHLRQYGEENWNAARIDERIARAAAWAEKHQVNLLCDEFGAYRPYSPVESRSAWLRDVRTAFEKYHIGWAMWEYDEEFGLTRQQDGKITLDESVARALGLNLPR